ncbi:MAG: transporter [Chthoniobacterales bacterium]|nr:transporter [Chthoniobacterales bacterium]
MKTKWSKLLILTGIFLPNLSNVATATEGGGTSKALGVDTVMAGVMPPPGLRLTNFLARYDSSHTLDGSGNDRANLSNFDLAVTAETLRFQYVWPAVNLLGANIETRVGFNAVSDVKVDFDVKTPLGRLHKNDSQTNFGDALFAPALFGWHSKQFHQTFGPEFFLPSGKFDKTRLANTGRGYFSMGPSYWFTWFPIKEVEVSGALIYLFNFENSETNYTSGNELSFDYNLGYSVTAAWQIGASGYLYKQITDDEQNGRVVGDGNRGQAVAVGPFLRYHPSKNFGIVLKWQHEEAVKNRTSGERIFLQFAAQLF